MSTAIPLVIDRLASAMDATIEVESSAFGPREAIPDTFTEYGHRHSPELHWSGVPDEAESVVVLAEDPDAHMSAPFAHWVLYNLPATVQALPQSVPTEERLDAFGGALQGRTTTGSVGYFGPRPPQNDDAHAYHFEVFALDRTLDLGPGVDREQLVAAMKGHVLASGELVGVYRAPAGR